MSTPLITFEEHDKTLSSIYRFYQDRIERDWKDFGSSGTDVIFTKNLSAEVTEQTTFGYGTSHRLRKVVSYSVTGSVLRFGFSHVVLHTIAYLSFACSVLVFGWLLYHLRKERWIYVKDRDGDTVLTFRQYGLQGINRDTLIRMIADYGNANETTDKNKT